MLIFRLSFFSSMMIKISSLRLLLPEKSLFGFKVLSSQHSVFMSYAFIFIEYLLIPLFGIKKGEAIAGTFFILLINFSIIILILNSVIRIKKINFFFLIIVIPLIIYIPFSIERIILSIENLIILYN